MEVSLAGKVAIITGASSGLGQELVRQFARAGAKVLFCARREAPLRALSQELAGSGLAADAHAGDVARPHDVDRLFGRAMDRHGRVDILVNNVGVPGPSKSIEHTALDEWNDTIASNLTGSFLCLRAAVPVMKREGGGAVVNIGSATARRALPLRVGDAAADMGMVGLTRRAAAELEPHRIRVNCLCPNPLASGRSDEGIAGQGGTRGIAAAPSRGDARSRSARRPPVTVDDVVRMALFLSSDFSQHITGQDFDVMAGSLVY